DDLAKVVQSEDGRFAAMPEEIDHRLRGDLDLLDDVLLQQVIGHAKRLGLRVEQLLLQVVAIVAVQVTDRPHRFGKDLKFTRSLDRHVLLPCTGVSLFGWSAAAGAHSIDEMPWLVNL